MAKNMIVLHHSATKDSETVSFDDIERFHTSWRFEGVEITPEEAKQFIAEGESPTPPWQDIGYHYAVENIDGSYYAVVGRPEFRDGAAVKEGNINRRGLHVVCIGDFDKVEPEAAMLEVLVKRILIPLCIRHNISWDAIVPHSQFAPYKTCPGKLFPLARVRAMVKEKLRDAKII